MGYNDETFNDVVFCAYDEPGWSVQQLIDDYNAFGFITMIGGDETAKGTTSIVSFF